MMALALLAALVLWLALPFVPAVHEALRRRDDGALPISDRYREDLGLADDVGPAEVGEVGRGAAPAHVPLIVRHSFIGPPRLSADEVRARGIARLSEGSTIRQRLVAGQSVEVDPGSVLHGTAEAGEHVWLGVGVQFERVHAPTVQVGVPPEGPPPPAPPAVAVGLEAEVLAGRALVRGDLTVPPGGRLEVDLVVTGDLVLGPGAEVLGDVKARGDLSLEAGARVRGSAFAGRSLRVGRYASVGGAAVAEDALALGEGSRVGRPEAPASATGREVVAASGARVHGTLWAEESGRTVEALPALGALA